MNEGDRELLDCFRNTTCESFSHEDHVHVAWLLLRQHSLTEAIEIFCNGARSLAADRGHPEYYHETITWAFMILINQLEQDCPTESWQLFRDRHAALLAKGKNLLKTYYRDATLESDFARRVFVLPDRHGFTSQE